MSKFDEIKELSQKYLMKTYGRLDIAFEKGKGARLWDTEGNEYVDFLAGIAVNNLGHSNEAVINAIKEQVNNLIHTSNLYYIEPQAKLAQLLIEDSCFGKAFFCNSGAEANEAAIKLARKYGKNKLNGKYEIISMEKSFHGRTMATITATGQEKYQKEFTPLPEGFKYAEFANIEDLKSKITDNTLAVMIEVIQGEGGLNTAPKEYFNELQKLLKERNILLIIDEVQTGVGRTGSLFAHQMYGLEPDIMSLAKGLGNGVAIGACLAKDDIALFVPGDHASTFGGNFLACVAGIEVIKQIKNEEFLYSVRKKGQYFKDSLDKFKDKYSFVKGAKGKGLMLGLEIEGDKISKVVSKMLEKKVLIGSAGGVALRFVPPLNVDREDIEIVLQKLDEVFSEI